MLKKWHGWALALSLVLSGCLWDDLVKPPQNISFEGPAKMSASDKRVLAQRLAEHALRSTLDYDGQAQPPRWHITAHGLAPSASALRYLLEHRGLFSLRSEQGAVWLTQADIVDAAVGYGQDDKLVLQLQVSPVAAERVAQASRLGTPVSLQIVLDGEVLDTASVSRPLTGAYYEMPVAKSVEELRAICAVLKHGVLSFQPRSVHVLPANTGPAPG